MSSAAAHAGTEALSRVTMGLLKHTVTIVSTVITVGGGAFMFTAPSSQAGNVSYSPPPNPPPPSPTPPPPAPPDITVDAFNLSASLTVEPGTCVLIPENDTVVVDGLGDGIPVSAYLTPHPYGATAMAVYQMIVNGLNVISRGARKRRYAASVFVRAGRVWVQRDLPPDLR